MRKATEGIRVKKPYENRFVKLKIGIEEVLPKPWRKEGRHQI